MIKRPNIADHRSYINVYVPNTLRSINLSAMHSFLNKSNIRDCWLNKGELQKTLTMLSVRKTGFQHTDPSEQGAGYNCRLAARH